MIRDYIDGDIDKIKVNQFTNIDDIKVYIDNPNIKKIVLEDKDIKAITCFFEYHKDCWEGFFIISENMDLYNIKQLKLLLKKLMMQYKPVRLQTTSLDCPKINKWMKFMEFELEGTKRKFMDGKDYKMWSIIDGR